MWTSTRGGGVKPMWTHVDGGGGVKNPVFVEVINGWPLSSYVVMPLVTLRINFITKKLLTKAV